MASASTHIEDRLHEFFERHLDVCETMRQYLDTLEQAGELSSADVDHLIERQTAFRNETKALEAEFWALYNEWQATPAKTEAGRTRVTTLAKRLDGLIEDLAQRFDVLGRKFHQNAQTVKTELDEVRSGMKRLQQFRPESGGGAGRIDRSV